jgi:hypothetical protein
MTVIVLENLVSTELFENILQSPDFLGVCFNAILIVLLHKVRPLIMGAKRVECKIVPVLNLQGEDFSSHESPARLLTDEAGFRLSCGPNVFHLELEAKEVVASSQKKLSITVQIAVHNTLSNFCEENN